MKFAFIVCFFVSLLPINARAYTLPEIFTLDFSISQGPEKKIVITGDTNLPDGVNLWVNLKGGENWSATYDDSKSVKVLKGKFEYKSGSSYPMEYKISLSYGGYGMAINNGGEEIFGKNLESLKRGLKDGKVSKDRHGIYLISTSRTFGIGDKAAEKIFLMSDFKRLTDFFEHVDRQQKALYEGLSFLNETKDAKKLKEKMYDWHGQRRMIEKAIDYSPHNHSLFYRELSSNISSAWNYMSVMSSHLSGGDILRFKRSEKNFLRNFNKAKKLIEKMPVE